jgi:hypothetical protein
LFNFEGKKIYRYICRKSSIIKGIFFLSILIIVFLLLYIFSILNKFLLDCIKIYISIIKNCKKFNHKIAMIKILKKKMALMNEDLGYMVFFWYLWKFLGKSVFALKVNLYEKPFMIIMIIFPIIITVVSFGLFISEQYKYL